MIKNTVMAAIVAVAPLAASAQGGTEALKGNPEAAKGKVAMCVGCHEIPGYKASFPSVYSVPKIVGQSSRYLEAALQGYRKGERSHPTMNGIAAGLSDQDIADLAAYYGTK